MNATKEWRMTGGTMMANQKERKKVFVVDSDTDGYQALTSPNSHHDVAFFQTGREALRTSSQAKPDIWLINIDLPDMNGIDLRTMLQERSCKSPVALVSNEYSVDHEMAARSAGVEFYFAKPLVSKLIMAAV